MAFIVFIYSPFYIHICTLANSDYLNEYTRLLFQIIFLHHAYTWPNQDDQKSDRIWPKKIDNDEL